MDLGGGYWAFTMATTQVTCLVASWIYCEEFDGAGKIDRSVVMGGIGSLSGAWALAILGLGLTMEQKYISTFLSFKTAKQYVEAVFLVGLEQGDDATCATIFEFNQLLWTRIKPDVREWLHGIAERVNDGAIPEWLTPGLVASMDVYFLPEGRFAEALATPLRGAAVKRSLR